MLADKEPNSDNFEILSVLGESIWEEVKERGGFNENLQCYLRDTINRLVFEHYGLQNLDPEKIRQSVLKMLDTGIL
jgi:hypothetical protein